MKQASSIAIKIIWTLMSIFLSWNLLFAQTVPVNGIPVDMPQLTPRVEDAFPVTSPLYWSMPIGSS